MTFQIDVKKQIILLVFYSCLALIIAYISEFKFGLEPCILCLYQRKPFFAVIILGLISVIFLRKENLQKISFFFCLLFLAINIVLSGYHVGVEKKIFKGPTTCSSVNLNEITNLEELSEALSKTKAIRCDEPSFKFLGLSMAGWNFLYCLFLVVLSLAIYCGKGLVSSLILANQKNT